MNKIFTLDNLKKEINSIKKKRSSLKFVMCHGTFDLIHPGHINHFKEAKKMGDKLIVTITGDKFVKKSLKPPMYSQDVRAHFLSNLEIVDYVAIVNDQTALKALNIVKPDIYCKGEEYKNNDDLGNLELEKKIAKRNRIKVKFVGKTLYSSSDIISKNFSNIQDNELKKNIKKFIINKKIDLKSIIESFQNLKILIIGEIIFDKYTTVKTVGTSPKAGVLSSTIQNEVIMPGGTLATYHFLKQFTKHISLVSVLNNKIPIPNKLINKKIKKNILISNEIPKVIKERVIESVGQEKYKKIITLNHFTKIDLKNKDENKILRYLEKNIKNFDIVLMQDFGHGFITKRISKIVQAKSKFLSLNVQTNSLNYGFNIISKKIKKADLFALDKRELELASYSISTDDYKSLSKLKKIMKAKFAFLTSGEKYSILLHGSKKYKINTLDNEVIDAMGAGDIFHAMSTLMSFSQTNYFLSLFVSQISGSLAVKIIGNKEFPKINQILRTYNAYINSIKSEKK